MPNTRTGPASLYVICYTMSMVKVGVTRDFRTRLAAHNKRARDLKIEYVSHFVTRPFDGAYQAERNLVTLAHSLGTALDGHWLSEWVRIADPGKLFVYAVEHAGREGHNKTAVAEQLISVDEWYSEAYHDTCVCGHLSFQHCLEGRGGCMREDWCLKFSLGKIAGSA